MLKTKHLIYSFLLLILSFSHLTAQSQAANAQPASASIGEQQQNYALLIRNFNHLKAAIKTVEMLRADGITVNEFETVICGKKITKIGDNTALIAKARQKGLTVTACGMSMKKFAMDKSDLPDGVQVVKNGLIRIYELQDRGYKTITL